jgi:hypothetical protein
MAGSDDSNDVAPVHPLLRPFVWLAAAVWLPLQKAGQLFVGFLHGYSRAADAAGRAVAKVARAIGRTAMWVFRPLGQVFAMVARFWHWISLKLQVFVLRPVGRWFQAVFRYVEPAARRYVRVVDRGLVRAAHGLAPLGRAIGHAARRLAAPPARVTRALVLQVRAAARSLAAAVRQLLRGGIDRS